MPAAKKPAKPVSMPAAKLPSLTKYYRLGTSGLRVSPLCLGTMTFGTVNPWGIDEKKSAAIVHRYVERGGNFLDTANMYQRGMTEEILGRTLRKAKLRDRLVLATKYTINFDFGDPNAGGNGRKSLMASLEQSLRRLQTDYIDLLWVHMWDRMTPVEEVMASLDAVVRAGKVRNVGFSDFPAWLCAKAQTTALFRGWEPLCALQLEYSLCTRDIEREYVALAHEYGLAITPWSPLAGGMLSGKYSDRKAKGRLTTNPNNPRLTERNFAIAEAVGKVAKAIDRHPAAVALNWVAKRPAVVSTIIGATSLEQLETNLSALEFDIPAEHLAALDEASRIELGFPHNFLAEGGFVQNLVRGETEQASYPAWYW